MVHLLIYIREKNNLGLEYYSKIEDAHIYDLFIQDSIKSDNQFMVFSDYRWQDYPNNGISTGSYIVFYQGVPIDNCTQVTGPVAHSSAESEYNASCTSGT